MEDLKSGDMLANGDGGLSELLWVHTRALEITDKSYPIRIRKGALGHGLPLRDLCVSRQHRILLRSPIVKRMTGEPEVWVPACWLLDMPGVETAREYAEVRYYHLMCRDHTILNAEGALAESFFAGPLALETLSPADQLIVNTILSEPHTLCRPVLDRKKRKQLLRCHIQANKALTHPGMDVVLS